MFNKRIYVSVFLLSSLFGMTSLSLAASKSLSADSPEKVVQNASDQLLAALEKEKVAGKKSPEKVQKLVEEIVGPIVDFDLIARRVMSASYSAASDKQRSQFTAVFREGLMKTYAAGIASYDNQEIVLLPFQGIKRKERNGKVLERANVDMEIRTPEGEVYPLKYSMYRTNGGDWLLENMILNGVNLGLTFRNQFNESLKANKGNLDKVIAGWDVTLGDAK